MLRILLALSTLFLTGCFFRAPTPKIPKLYGPPTPGESAISASVDSIEQQLIQATQELAASQQKVDGLKAGLKQAQEAEARERQRRLVTASYVVSGCGFAAALIGVALLAFGIGKSVSSIVIALGVAVGVAGIVGGWVIPIIARFAWLIFLAVIGAIGFILWKHRKDKDAMHEMGVVGQEALERLREFIPDKAVDLIEEAKKRQKDKGIHTHVLEKLQLAKAQVHVNKLIRADQTVQKQPTDVAG